MDYYKSNNENQFKDIQLQLHASSSVSNPYTFNIQGNKSFNGVCAEALPSAETYLYNKLITDNTYEDIYEDIKISIPSNCKVLKVAVYVNSQAEMEDTAYAVADIKNTSNNISWINEYDYNNNHDACINVVKYVGVTPNKTYALHLELDAYADYEVTVQYISCQISYSSGINSHSVDIKDY